MFDFLRVSALGEIYDEQSRIYSHKTLLSKKYQSYSVISDMHKCIIERKRQLIQIKDEGLSLEVGSGVIPYSDLDDSFLSSDVILTNNVNLICDIENLPFQESSLDAIVQQFVFHHIGDIDKSIRECIRALKKQGLILLIEPTNTLVSRLLFPNMHKSETYDRTENLTNIYSSSKIINNQAISEILFLRNYDEFKFRYPELELIHYEKLNFGLRYILSGGLNFKQIAPDFFFTILKKLENNQKNLLRKFAVHHLIVLKKL